jgi:3' terminal RNA ribose 2'-O-methyltransferase Hen1
MLLTLTTTHRPATDLGYLLHKNPARLHSFQQSYGTAHVFYPEADSGRCTAALLVEVDPIGLVRNRRGRSGDPGLLGQYVNDRPYAASSLLSVAIADVFGTALNGRCADRPDLVGKSLDLCFRIPSLPCRGGERMVRSLFEPLGYEVTARRLPLDERFQSWGESAYFDTTLRVDATLQSALTHLYVLIPVLDNDKHYWVGEAEVEKLLRHGEPWLGAHPERDLIIRRYLKHKRSLERLALDRLLEAEEQDQAEDAAAVVEVVRGDQRESALERGINLNDRRLQEVSQAIERSGATSVIDLGCGEGKLLRALLTLKQLTRVTGLDVAHRALELARDRLNLERLPKMLQEKVALLHGSLIYRDKRVQGYDAATVIEVIEHLDEARLGAFERVLFEVAKPRLIVVTTPNQEYNTKFSSLAAGAFRHPDHRFEWTRQEFEDWARRQCARFGYEVAIQPIGDEDPSLGAPTQMALFRLAA